MPELVDISIDKEIDARGSFCPGPLMELIRGMKALPVGGVLAVLSSDPGSAKDIPAWIQKAKHAMKQQAVDKDGCDADRQEGAKKPGPNRRSR